MRKDALEHYGYKGSVEYSREDDVLYGKILDIDDLVSYEGNSLAALKQAFHEAVVDYIETCKALGKNMK